MAQKKRENRSSSLSLTSVSLLVHLQASANCEREGPVVDLTDEMPYEKVNCFNNHMVPHGLCRYMKSVFIGRAQDEVTPKIMDSWLALSNDKSPVQYAIFHEYFPGGKISSVSADTTAFFHRKKTSHALCLATWKENTQENFEIAKKGARQLVQPSIDLEAIPEDLGYSNYSQCFPFDDVLDLTRVVYHRRRSWLLCESATLRG